MNVLQAVPALVATFIILSLPWKAKGSIKALAVSLPWLWTMAYMIGRTELNSYGLIMNIFWVAMYSLVALLILIVQIFRHR